MTKNSKIVTSVGSAEPLSDDYERLLASGADRPIFLCADWLNTWVEIFGAWHETYWIRVTDDRELIGFAPFAVSEEGGLNRLRRLTIAGQHPTSGEHLDIVAAPGFEARVAEAVAETLMTTLRRKWDVITFQRMLADSPVLPHLTTALESRRCPTRIEATGTSPYLALPQDPEDLLKGRSRNFRGQVNQSRNRVGRLGEVEVAVSGEGLDLDEGLDELFRLHRLRWEEESAFATPEKEAFHRRLAARLAARDGLYLALLKVDGKAIAARYDYVYNRKLWCMQGGWDPTYQDARPGTFTTEAVLLWGIERGLEEYDFLAGEHGYKNRWADESRDLVTFVAANPSTVRGRVYERSRFQSSD